ncbi:GAF domain-containing protein [Scopulibacillus darangshiensis]|uniref:GAF domain-containing protein n=1 Tax=Scopulibacillus darangshiensis TaxID=442528 RepID=A0A4R2NH44_9BACL|nr:helix-turn-helix domain-containing protein [Scopulibacillus darangshiensis]TCP20769.1 GAF domain-containing protein [Scopulibacillus darangshiensis]
MQNKDSFLQQLKLENQKVQQALMNLIECYKVINSTLELDEVLKKIMYFALNIAHNADAGFIQLYEEHSDKLIIKSYVGFNDNIESLKVSIGESITGKVFRDGNVRLIDTKEKIYESMADTGEENLNCINNSCKHQDIKSILSLPISFGTNRIGVMTLHRYDIKHSISEMDLLLLQSFASQAAIAIHNAKLHTEAQNSLREITSLSKKLKKTNGLLAKKMTIHNHLTRLSIQNKGLDAIIVEMNKQMEKKVFYADYINGKCIPAQKSHIVRSLDDMFFLFTNKSEPAFVSVSDTVQTNCYVYPIRSGSSSFLGCLIVEGSLPLSELDHLIIEQGAPILTLEIMKLRSQTEVMYKKTYEKYQQFLKTKKPQQAAISAKDLGINNHHFLQTALIELDGNVDLHSLENEAFLLLTYLEKKLPLENSLLFSHNNKITFFSSSHNNDCEKHFIDVIKNNISWWNQRFTVKARAGISTGVYYPGEAVENHEKAEKALLHLKKQNNKGVLHYKDIGISRLFLHHHSEEITSYLHETFSLLWTEQDENSELLHTMVMYVQNNRSMTLTAKDLHIHTNTLYNRIKKIEKLVELDFNNYEDYLKMELAVYLYKAFVV